MIPLVSRYTSSKYNKLNRMGMIQRQNERKPNQANSRSKIHLWTTRYARNSFHSMQLECGVAGKNNRHGMVFRVRMTEWQQDTSTSIDMFVIRNRHCGPIHRHTDYTKSTSTLNRQQIIWILDVRAVYRWDDRGCKEKSSFHLAVHVHHLTVSDNALFHCDRVLWPV